MKRGIDSSSFPVGQDIDYQGEEIEQLARLEQRARNFIGGHAWTLPIAEFLLAFGIAPMIGLFLVRFEHAVPGSDGRDTELWLVAGDCPPAYFVCDEAPTPSIAREVYCELMEDWADRVLAEQDLSESYPVEAAPTTEHAEMLKSRLAFIREKLIPLAV